MLILENGDLYSFYGRDSLFGFQVAGFIQGVSISIGSTLTAPSVTNFNYDNIDKSVVRSNGSLTATVVAGVSLDGSSSGSSTATFTSTPTTATYSSYSYDTPAALVSITGTWLGFLLDQTDASANIDAAGVLSGTNLGCSFNGTVTPRASDKNVFNVSFTFGNSHCTAPGVTTNGVAISYVLPSGKRRLMFATQDSSKALGYLFYSER